MQNENEAYVWLLCGHLEGFIHRLREIPPDRWEWQPEPPAPSCKILAEHAWQWLVCDRYHIGNPDVLSHPPVPDPPADQQAMCDVLKEETENWRTLIRGLTPEQMLEPRRQFGMSPVNVRWFICHMVQNLIYKHGQMATIYFTLGLDGTEPYTAPFPNPIYKMVHDRMSRPLFKAIWDGDADGVRAALQAGADPNERDLENTTPLMGAAYRGNVAAVRALLDAGADVQAKDNEGYSVLGYAEASRNAEIVEMLTQAGAQK